MKPDIIFEDQDVIVIYKPAGLPAQTPRAGVVDVVSYLKTYRVQKGEPAYIGLVQRLDQPVEGIMVLAKTKEAAANLSRQITSRQVEKNYMAAAYLGEQIKTRVNEEMTLTDYLIRDGRTNMSSVVSEHEKGGKKAVLHCRLCKKDGDAGIFLIRLETGRHHQIRVQMANAGFPLYGDQKYGKAEGLSVKNVALCAVSVKFFHPRTKKIMKFEIEPKGEIFSALS